MNRTEAKARLTQLRKEIDANEAAMTAMCESFFAGDIDAETATTKETEMRATRAKLAAEFKEISSLPCCNI